MRAGICNRSTREAPATCDTRHRIRASSTAAASSLAGATEYRRGLAGRDAREHAGTVFFYQKRRLTHYVATDATSVGGLNRVTGNTGNSVVVEGPFDVRILCQRAGKKRGRVVASLPTRKAPALTPVPTSHPI